MDLYIFDNATLINLLGDAVSLVKQSTKCVSLVHQFTELIYFSWHLSSTFSFFSFKVFVDCAESIRDL